MNYFAMLLLLLLMNDGGKLSTEVWYYESRHAKLCKQRAYVSMSCQDIFYREQQIGGIIILSFILDH